MIFHHDPLVEKAETEVHGINRDEDKDEEDDDDDDETLSFCEFSINSSDSDLWGNSSSGESSQNSSFKSSQEEEADDCSTFEFFSSTTHDDQCRNRGDENSISPQNIIFCGKLISYKEPTSENIQKVVDAKQHKKKKITRRGIFRWKWNHHHFSPTSHMTERKKMGSKSAKEKNSSRVNVTSSGYKSLIRTEAAAETSASKQRKKHNKKEQDLLSSVHKIFSSRWYLVFFGITKYRTKMELRDMKIRQNRRSRRSFSSSSPQYNDGKSTSVGVCLNKSKRFWAVLRALSCVATSDRRSSDEVVVRPSTAAAGSIPSVL